MPTTLPPPRRNGQLRTTGRLVFDILFNGALLASALVLTVVVAVKAQIATGQPQVADRTTQQRMMDASSKGHFALPPD